jgi:hypothetical protein
LRNKINQEKDEKITIKRIRTKYDIKIKWNKMLKDKIEKKIKKMIKKTKQITIKWMMIKLYIKIYMK